MATINGTDNGETINGTSATETINGLGGNDILNGIGGDDTLNGGDGDDILKPGPPHATSYSDGRTGASLYVIADGGAGTDTIDLSNEYYINVSLNEGKAFFSNYPEDSDYPNPHPEYDYVKLTSIENVIGTPTADLIDGYVYSGTTTHVLSGGGGGDQITGGTGDTLNGDADNDTLTAIGTNVTAHGGAGSDILRGSLGGDVLDGGADDDTVDGGAYVGVAIDLAAGTLSKAGIGSDQLISVENAYGSSGDDVITGNDAANTLNGKGGKDTIHAGGGNDLIVIEKTDFALIDGGGGTDTVKLQAFSTDSQSPAITVDLAAGFLLVNGSQHQFLSIENVLGQSRDPGVNIPIQLTLLGTTGANILQGNGATSVINGRGGNDSFANGNVSFAGAAVGVTVDLTRTGAQDTGYGTDKFAQVTGLIGGDHDDVLTGTGAATDLRGGLGNDRLGNGIADYRDASAGTSVNLVLGTAQDGDGGTDALATIFGVVGSDHDDTITPDLTRAGALALDARAGSDTLDLAGARQAVAVDLGSRAAQAVGQAVLTLAGFENVTGGGFDDRLSGTDGANRLIGGAGADTLLGQGGDDLLDGGTGANRLDGGYGSDTLIGGGIKDVLDGGASRSTGDVDTVDFSGLAAGTWATVDLTNTGMQTTHQGRMEQILHVQNLIGSAGNDTLTGNAENNVFRGNDGKDTLNGGDGDDVLIGGAGRDVLTGGAGNDRFVYTAPVDSMVDAKLRDQIMDFTHGQDKIDLSALAAYSYGTLRLIGPTAFDHAGEIREYQLNAANVIIDADLDGDGRPDFEIDVKSDHLLVGSDFIL